MLAQLDPQQISLYALFISGGALLISIISFVVNLWYTRRRFKATYNPEFTADLGFGRGRYGRWGNKEINDSRIVIEVENLSTSNQIQEIKYSIQFRERVAKFIIWKKGWKEHYAGIDYQTLPPANEREYFPHKINNRNTTEPITINDTLLEHFPGLVTVTSGPERVRAGKYTGFINPQLIDVKLIVECTSPNGSKNKITRLYILHPKLVNFKNDQLLPGAEWLLEPISKPIP